MPYVHKETGFDTSLERYTGRFMMPLTRPPYMANFLVEIVESNGKLFIRGPGVPDIQLKRESTTKFFYGDGTDQQIEFEKSGRDKKYRVFYTGYGVKREVSKVN